MQQPEGGEFSRGKVVGLRRSAAGKCAALLFENLEQLADEDEQAFAGAELQTGRHKLGVVPVVPGAVADDAGYVERREPLLRFGLENQLQTLTAYLDGPLVTAGALVDIVP